MPAVGEFYRLDGVLKFALSASPVRIFGSIATGSGNGSVTDARFAEIGQGAALFTMLVPGETGSRLYERPVLSLAGNTLSWTWPEATTYPSFLLVYGSC